MPTHIGDGLRRAQHACVRSSTVSAVRDNEPVADDGQIERLKDIAAWNAWRQEHPDERLRGRLMAPFLERPYKECLERGDFELHIGEIDVGSAEDEPPGIG